MSNSLALLGDSIFDNSAYTGGDPDVVTHLRGFLPPGWVALLLAIDGSVTTDLQAQLERVGDESHLIISVGGNDAIMNSDLLGLPVSSTAEALLIFGERMSYFESAYRAAIDAALIPRRQTTVCTIYNADLPAADPTCSHRANVIQRYYPADRVRASPCGDRPQAGLYGSC
jgi:hypothetical protein